MWYSPIEQHVNAVYQALLATEALTGPSEVHLSHCWMGACCGCQTQEFGGTVLYSSQMECLPAATHKLSTSPLSHKLQQVLGPVLCQAPATTRLIPDMPVSIIREGETHYSRKYLVCRWLLQGAATHMASHCLPAGDRQHMDG